MGCMPCRYVMGKDVDANLVYLSRRYFDQDKRRDAFSCGAFNWLSDARPEPSRPLLCKVRHGPTMYRCGRVGIKARLLSRLPCCIQSPSHAAVTCGCVQVPHGALERGCNSRGAPGG